MSLFRTTVENRDLSDSGGRFGRYLSPSFGAGSKAALSVVPVYSATSLIADSLAILPLTGYEFTGGKRARIDPQPGLCSDPHPSEIYTRVEWLHQFATSFLLRGNAYGIITALDGNGIPSKVAWLNPDNVRVDESRSDVVYLHHEKRIDPATLLHVPWYPQPGSVVGLSPIERFRAQLETGNAAVEYGRSWFRNGSMPSGHLKYSGNVGHGTLNDEQAQRVKARFKAAVAGNDLFVSGTDWDWTALSVKPDDAAFIQTLKATANQVAAIYRVSPEDIGGEAGSSLTYATVELNQIKFQTRALQPIFTRLEHHLSRLLPANQYVKFNPDAIVRTDLKTRMEAHAIALKAGIETQDEGRALEDKEPLTPAEQKLWLQMYGGTKPTPKDAP